MPTGAKYFQEDLDIAKSWQMDSILLKMVEGQFAIEDIDIQSVQYVSAYTSKPERQMGHVASPLLDFGSER